MHAVIHQKPSFQESAVSFPAPTFLLSVSWISSHQLAVYKPLTVYLFWVLNCAKEAPFPFVSVLCFPAGFHPIPREKPQELLEGNFFDSPFFSFFYIVKQKRQVKDESCKSLFWSWSVSHQPGMVWHSHLSLLSPSVVLHQP